LAPSPNECGLYGWALKLATNGLIKHFECATIKALEETAREIKQALTNKIT
jgi:hypothetical protein